MAGARSIRADTGKYNLDLFSCTPGHIVVVVAHVAIHNAFTLQEKRSRKCDGSKYEQFFSQWNIQVGKKSVSFDDDDNMKPAIMSQQCNITDAR